MDNGGNEGATLGEFVPGRADLYPRRDRGLPVGGVPGGGAARVEREHEASVPGRVARSQRIRRIRSRGLMIPVDVSEGSCVGRAGFILSHLACDWLSTNYRSNDIYATRSNLSRRMYTRTHVHVSDPWPVCSPRVRVCRAAIYVYLHGLYPRVYI